MMARETDETLTAQIVETHSTLTLGQLCRSCGVHAEWVTLLVEEGVLEPERADDRTRWAFAAHQLPRLHSAVRLQRDLGLNASGVALALELMDEVRALRRRLDARGER